MASAELFQVEDQTDEDFFDKLVGDDEFGLAGSGPASGDMAKALSNMSLGDVGTSVDNFEAEEKNADEKVPVSEEHREMGDLVTEESANAELRETGVVGGAVRSSDEDARSGDAVKAETEVGSPGSSMEKSVGSKGTSIKVVQWSSFSSGQGQLDLSGSGLYSDFFTGVSNGSYTQLAPGTYGENSVADLNASFSSFETQDIQDLGVSNEQTTFLTSSEQLNSQAYGAYNEQVTAGNESQYWENAYPGWKYDANTGQWHQVDSYDTTQNVQVDGYSSEVANYQENLQASTELADDGPASGKQSEISYLRQTTQSVVETVSDDYTTGNVSNWNQVLHENTEYPSNMVFDPQYPGWYYDKNTLGWCSLESYNQSLQSQQTQDVGASMDGFFSDQSHSLYNKEVGQLQTQALGSPSTQEQGDWGGYSSSYHQHNIWQPEQDHKSETAFAISGEQTMSGNFYSSQNLEGNNVDQQTGLQTMENVQNPLHGSSSSVGTNSFSAFVPAKSSYQFTQPKAEQLQHANVAQSYYLNQNSTNYSQQFSQSESASYSQFSYTPNGGRTLEGRPPHALVTFGFGGKLIVMKDTTSFSTNLAYGSQDASKGEFSVLNLAEVVMDKTDSSTIGNHCHDYFHCLCKQSFPGPLVGGNAATKDLNKWIDERITSCESSTLDFRKGELLRLLLSLLKISCQHYGKLRSPFGVDPSLQEADSPELAVTRLFASARKNGDHLREYGVFTHCMHNLPSEGQIRKTAVEVQNLLVSGRRKEALQCAQEGQLWGPALLLAAQLGDKFYIDTVKQMAHRQFVSGSPLRTLCLLIAGQPADVFSTDSSSNNSLPGSLNMSQQPVQVSASGMLDDWEENLAIITANRTKDDELVIIHLGDCLWKERGEVTASHTCYLVAEANFESYSDKARLCLIGADHWKCPRTYASPEAIQRTELYEYSKVLGNSQFILLPFQPYKLVYAYMLAEVGKVSDSLKYCQAILKSLKNSGRDPEVETWKGLVSSLEDRLRAHQQGGYGTNLAPGKLVGKIFTSIDRSLHRMIGAPPSLPPIPPNNLHGNELDNNLMASKVGNSQSTMAMSTLLPSASVEMISEWTGDNRKSRHNRSISEPDFGRSPKQMNPSGDASATDHSKSSGASRFGLFGTQFLQKTIGWMSRSRQAKLGESNKFYYDEKLKRWVEEGAEPPAEEAALPPPPTTSSFQNHVPEYNTNNAFSTASPSNGMLETKTYTSTEHSPGIPPMPPTQNQFSARGRMGVRSRYVDTFNKGGGMSTATFQSPSVPSVKPVGGPKFFVPSPVASSEPTTETTESTQEGSSTEAGTTSVGKESSFSPLSSSSFMMQRFPSVDNIPSTRNKGMGTPSQNGNGSLSSRSRAASWSGSYSDAFNLKTADTKPIGDGLGIPSSFTANNPSQMHPITGLLHSNGSSLSDDLHEVEL